VVQDVTVSGRAGARQLVALGVDAGAFLSGPVALRTGPRVRRSGKGEITVNADLASAALKLPQAGWNKPVGQSTTADVHVLIDHGRPTGIDRLDLKGPNVEMRGYGGDVRRR
jgi:hypothetical protein